MPDRVVTIRVNLEGLDEASASTQKYQEVVRGVGTAAQESATGAAALSNEIDKAEAALAQTATAAETTAAAVEQVGVGAASVEKVGTAAESAKKGTDNLARGVGELTGTLKEKLGPSAEAAYAAFEKLSTAASPKALQRALLDATLQTEAFKKAIDEAKASGENFAGPGGRISAAVRAMEKDIDAATKRMGQMRDVMGDIAVRANQSGQSFEYLRGAGGGLNGMFNSLESSSTGALSAVGKLGIATIGIAGIFTAAKEIGLKLGEAMAFVVDKASKLEETQRRGAESTARNTAILAAAEKGLIGYGGTLSDLARAYDLLVISQGRGSDAALKHAAAFSGLNIEATKFVDIEKKAEAANALLAGAYSRSSQEFLEMAKKSEGALRAYEEGFRRAGEAVPEYIRKAIDALNALANKTKFAAEAQADFNKKTEELPGKIESVGSALVKLQAAYQKEAVEARKAAGEAIAARDDEIKKLRDAGLSEEEYYERKKAAVEKADAAVLAAAQKETAARQAEATGLADLAIKYRMTATQMEAFLQAYLKKNAAQAEAVRSDEEMSTLQSRLAVVLGETADKAGTTAGQMAALQTALEGVGKATDALVQ